MQSGKAFLLCLGVSFHLAASQQLSSGGCTCKSACDKSWMHSGGPWCYVDSKCKASGWDSCQDTQMLYAVAVKENARDRQALQDAVKAGADLKRQLAEANSQRQDIEYQVGSLKQQLAAATSKQQATQKRVIDVQRKSDAQLKGMEQKLAEAVHAHGSQAEAHDAKLEQVQKNLAEAEDMKKQNAVTIKVMQQKIMQAEDAQQKAAAKIEVTEKKLQQAQAKAKETGDKLEQALKKEADTESNLQEARRQASLEAVQHKEDLSKMEAKLAKQVEDSDRKLKEADGKLKDEEAASTKLKEELAEAHQKQAETEKASKAVETVKKDVEKQLHDIKVAHDSTKEKLRQQIQETHQAKVDAKIYKIFKEANDKTYARARLRATAKLQGVATPLYMKQ